MWYKTIMVDSVECPYEAAEKLYKGFEKGVDDVWWSVMLSPDARTGWTLVIEGEEDHTYTLHAGLNRGHSANKVTGAQIIKVLDPSGTVVKSATGGLCVDSGCPSLIYNSNYQVIGLEDASSTKTADAEETPCKGSSCKGTVFDSNGPLLWRNIDCTWYTVENASIEVLTRWNTLFTESAWTDLNKYWLSYPHEGGLNYSNEFFWNPHTALTRVQASVTNQIGDLTETFAGFPSSTLADNLVMDFLGLGFALFTSPLFSRALERIQFYDSSLQLRNLKDTTNSLVANGVTVIKDVIATDSTPLELGVENTLERRLDKSIDTLHALMTDGKLLENAFDVPGDKEIAKLTEKAIFGLLIPMTWSLSPKTHNAVVIDSQSSSAYISSSMAKKAYVCHNDNHYYLADVVSLDRSCQSNSQGGQFCRDPDVRTLPGIDALDGTSWGGVTLTDLVVGAVNTWSQMGNTSAFFNPSDIGALEDIYDNSIRSAGVVHIPVETISEPKEALD
ncbi:hypothetical protein P170DRAFT_431326 [Aspergillus steynii IBT 23096]|uniref:Uncharacterized protein n=1 Tax=Aspergillus steynii IBT 23096 TaxID=1392250 RepID=A0A2I2FRY2_9EURO|nr:uncharacterized protein P170DRAFT_431326 [Aspergillus steynii IBT 23096]PLB43381.1 hypothetical protein P170DRAFT_431326 [Aspergillus steynii IBT 23096]